MPAPTDWIRGVPCELVDDGRHDVGVGYDDGRVLLSKCEVAETDAAERLGVATCGRLLHDILRALDSRGSRMALRGEVFDDLEEVRFKAMQLADPKPLPYYRRPPWARHEVVRALLAERLVLALDRPVIIEPKTIRIAGERTPSLYMLMPDTASSQRMTWVLANGPGDERLRQNDSLHRYTALLGRGGVLNEG